MQITTITVPLNQQKTANCLSCQAELRYAIIPQMHPHLYCTHCHNGYHENDTASRHIPFWRSVANRKLHDIQDHAPACSCGGMFLVSAFPHCTHCGRQMRITLPSNPKERLAYDELVVFADTTMFVNAGTQQRYQFGV